ncbi:succinate dehydrogenase [Actibacterium ureilyticum]|uniref:succinate dehydrogenase n=1 Tax=Actibacterium ureilyticum TaxID=1590614 RepID=UPI000BAB1A8B|nr:succinate dehydrogenase [Actibacterium ureilyticum]
MRLAALCLGALVLAGCDVANGVAEQTSRDLAKQTVNSVVKQRFPGANVAPYTDCIIDNATTQEILSLAGEAVTGKPSQKAVETVVTIAGRPEATQCLTRAALGAFAG